MASVGRDKVRKIIIIIFVEAGKNKCTTDSLSGKPLAPYRLQVLCVC